MANDQEVPLSHGDAELPGAFLPEYVRHATLPLFKPDGRRPSQLVGCCVAVRRENEFFLLTAAHVVVDLDMGDFHVYTAGGWVMAAGQIAMTDPDRRGIDRSDAAVIRLDPSVINDHLREMALTSHDLDDPGPAGPGNHLLMQLGGYPSAEVGVDYDERSLSPTWFQWEGSGCDERAYVKRGYKPKLHSLIDFDRSLATGHKTGRRHGPSMKGVSGSGIWRMMPRHRDARRERCEVLNAVFTRYEGRVIFGTRVTQHIGLINRYFPGDAPSSR